MSDKPEPRIGGTSRPTRIAYLLEDGQDSHGLLDIVIGSCLSRHGGRQSLIVPVIAGKISARYRSWLEAIDPDKIILLTYDNASVAKGLGRKLASTALTLVERSKDKPIHASHLHIHSPELTSLSWLPFLKAVSGTHRAPVRSVLDRFPSWKDDGFILDNFGTLQSSFSTFPIHTALDIEPVLLSGGVGEEQLRMYGLADAGRIDNGYAALDQIGNRGGVTTLAHLSNLSPKSLHVEHSWSSSFCLVVGDSFEERICCWNAGLLYDDAQYQAYKTLRVPSNAKTSPFAIHKIGKFLQRNNWIGRGSNGPCVTIRSASLDTAGMETIAAQLRPQVHSTVETSALDSIDDCVPEQPEGTRRLFALGQPIAPSIDLGPAAVSSTVSLPVPKHLDYCAGLHPVFSDGSWRIDLRIDRLNDQGKFSNIREYWQVPIRPQLVTLFSDSPDARLIRTGEISLRCNISGRSVTIKQPDDAALFHMLVCSEPTYQPGDPRSVPQSKAPYAFCQPSDKGRYLQGMLGLFGSLNDADQVLTNRFWRKTLQSMTVPGEDRKAELVTFLQRRLKAVDGPLVVEDEDDWDVLYEWVVQTAKRVRMPNSKTRYDKLLEKWTVELTEAVDASPNLSRDRDRLLEGADRELKDSLEYLLRCRIFFRGHEWVCRSCSHRNWLNVDALADELACEVCNSDYVLPVDLALDFRLNEFLATCLREHDTLSICAALSAIREERGGGFIFSPQLGLYGKYPECRGEKPNHEVDLLCISGGKLFVGEVKRNVAKITEAEMRSVVALAIEIDADVVVLAALEGEQRALHAKVEKLATMLPAGMSARGYLSTWDTGPSHYLPS